MNDGIDKNISIETLVRRFLTREKLRWQAKYLRLKEVMPNEKPNTIDIDRPNHWPE